MERPRSTALELALALRAAGLRWVPVPGDRFVVLDRDMDDEVFVVSDMVVEVRESPVGPLLAFNGTTEWALDSLEADEAVWLPREDQLRELLGTACVALERLGGEAPGWAATTDTGGTSTRHVDATAEAAYARAVLALLGRDGRDGRDGGN